jgi:hypothetical protein
MAYLAVKFIHVIGAAVLLGTGAGTAFFMLIAHLRGNVKVILGVARIVVLADFLFTATAVVLQPVTGVWLAWASGYSLLEGWIFFFHHFVCRDRRFLVAGGVDADADARPRDRSRQKRHRPAPALPPPLLDLVRVRFPCICGGTRDFLADDREARDDRLVDRSAGLDERIIALVCQGRNTARWSRRRKIGYRVWQGRFSMARASWKRPASPSGAAQGVEHT